ncbi:MAG: hypothetical protein HYV24_08080 [Deltaproteobacteria bacterium]|nr:hypothetical protein [Deltaproteobacteria bacterium]
MARPMLVIEEGRASIKAAVFSSSLDEKASVTISTGADIRASYEKVFEAFRPRFRSFSAVIVSLPPSAMRMNTVNVPITDKRKLDATLPFEAKDLFAGDTEGLILEGLPLADGRALVAAADLSAVKERVGALSALGAEPSWIGSSLYSKTIILGKLTNKRAALVDDESIVVADGGRPVFFKSLKDAADLKLALSAMKEQGAGADEFFILNDAFKDALASYGKDIRNASGIKADGASLLAMAEHYKRGIKDSIDFMRGGLIESSGASPETRQIRISFALIAALAVLWAGYSALRYKSMNAEAASLKSSIRESYSRLFPGETRLSDPSHQLLARSKGLQDEKGMISDGVDLPEALKAVAKASEGLGIRVHELKAARGRLTARGEAPSFEKAEAFRDSLSKGFFTGVAVTDLKSSASGGVTFNVSASIPEER